MIESTESQQTETVDCHIYKTAQRDQLYLYVAEEDAFDDVPEPVMKLFKAPIYVMQLTLSESRTLAQEDVLTVMENLREQGFHLQMPPKDSEVIASYPTRDELIGPSSDQNP